ncbi:hypothetical protein ACS0TY_009366 [Phlomoides rotata]
MLLQTSVPSGYFPDVENHGTDQEIKRTGEHLRKCDKCSVLKPPRAHHCRVCRRCVLKMDHHCAWVNNCVGQRNYKSFLLLVFYATVSCSYSSVLIICCTIEGWDSIASQRLKIFHVGCGLWSVGLSLTLGTLFIWSPSSSSSSSSPSSSPCSNVAVVLSLQRRRRRPLLAASSSYLIYCSHHQDCRELLNCFCNEELRQNFWWIEKKDKT